VADTKDVAVQQAMAAKADGKKVRLRTGFHQAWLLGDQTSRQALARLNDFRTTLADLGAHDFDLAEFILDEEVIAVIRAINLFGLTGTYAANITGGTCDLIFGKDGLSASVDVDQCRADALMDDLWSVLEIEGVPHILWRMGRHSGSSVAYAKSQTPDMNNPSDWQPAVECGSSVFGKVNEDFPGWSPPGHDPHCWPNMWRSHAYAVLGAIARIRKLEIAKQGLLPALMRLPVSTLQGTGKRTAQWISAHVQSAKLGGSMIRLESAT
jgi:hypothetical protein